MPITEYELNPGTGAFFDSGTTLVQMPANVRNSLFRTMGQWCKSDQKNCGGYNMVSPSVMCFKFKDSIYSNVKEWKNSFPKITFMFEGDKPYIFHPSEYMHPYDPEDGKLNNWCLGIRELPGRVILASNFMSHYDIFFDRVSKSLSFVRSRCNEHDYDDSVPYDENNSVLPVAPISKDPISNKEPGSTAGSIKSKILNSHIKYFSNFGI